MAANTPVLIADRGNTEEFPEHSFAGIRSALALGVKSVRLDVQLSADGIPMLAHDVGLLRTSGIDKSVLNVDAATLEATCIGEPQRFGKLFADVGMLRLSDALGLLNEYADATFFVDLQHASIAHFGHEQVVQAVVDCARAVRARIVMLSADLPAVYRARQGHGFRIGWRLDQLDSHTRLKYQALLPDFLECSIDTMPASGRMQRGPWEWIVSGVQTPAQLEAARERGVSYVATPALRTLLAAAEPA